MERSQASGREQPRSDAAIHTTEIQSNPREDVLADVRERSRPTASEFQDRYITHLEEENKFLRGQNTVLLERVKETNILTGRLQEMLTPLLGPSDRPAKATERDHANNGTGSPQQG